MNILIAPDSYKGSLTAAEVAEIVKEAFSSELPDAKIEIAPMADGGEGTLDAILSVNAGAYVETSVTGPMGDTVQSKFGLLNGGKTAVIEAASVVGLGMVPRNQRNPMLTTTFGMGELILKALGKGSRDFIIGLGGSATNDGGLGMLTALGGKFWDVDGNQVQPIAASLSKIVRADLSGLHPNLRECDFKIASDVENPLCGRNGASYVFGPQKGASPEQVVELDIALKSFADITEKALGGDFQTAPGAGAAGGLGFAFMLIGGKIHSGARMVAEAIGLEEKMEDCAWVITGEGQSDGQTVFGKVPWYVAALAKDYGAKAVLISGSLGEGYEVLLDHFVSCHAIVNRPSSLEEVIKNSRTNLYACATNIARLIAHSRD